MNIIKEVIREVRRLWGRGLSFKRFSPKVIFRKSLGLGWAGNTVNTSIFRCQGIFSTAGIQFGAFYADEKTIRLFKRVLATGAVEFYDLTGVYKVHDAHNSISLGIDREGFLHLCYDHHVSKLRYRRGMIANSISNWTDELEIPNSAGQRVTYPSFILPKNDLPLLLLYRDGGAESGLARIKKFDEQTLEWEDFSSPVLNGVDQRPWPCNGYWNTPCRDKSGHLHLGFVWRTRWLGAGALVNNINICYAKLDCPEEGWFTAAGVQGKLPITPVTCEVAHPSPPGGNLMNQSGMAVDETGSPHIVFYSKDPEGIPQYQYLRREGNSWRHNFVTQRSGRFDLAGKGTLRIPISRPEVIVSKNGVVYLIFRGDISGGRLAVAKITPPDFMISENNTFFITDFDLGYSEPIVDKARWEHEGILSVFVQKNDQPDNEGPPSSDYQEIFVFDVVL